MFSKTKGLRDFSEASCQTWLVLLHRGRRSSPSSSNWFEFFVKQSPKSNLFLCLRKYQIVSSQRNAKRNGIGSRSISYSGRYSKEKPSISSTEERNKVSVYHSGVAMSTFTNPIWFIKTRLQINSKWVPMKERKQLARERKRRSEIFEPWTLFAKSTVKTVFLDFTKVEKSLRPISKMKSCFAFVFAWSGISASYVGVSETIVHFVIYENLKSRLESIENQSNLPNFFAYLTAGACSKSCATTLCYPHEVVRTRLREEGNKYRTFFQTLMTVYREETYRGLYRGLLTHLIRQIPVRKEKCFVRRIFVSRLDFQNTAIMMSTYELIVFFLLSKSKAIPKAIEAENAVIDEAEEWNLT